jgi:predicted transcriptional regulator
MEQENVPDVKTVFEILSDEGKRLLIAMSHASHNSGMKIDAIRATSNLEDKKLEQALSLLGKNNLVQCGKMENREFVLNKDGDRFRLPYDVKKSVLTDIVKLDKQKVEELLRY